MTVKRKRAKITPANENQIKKYVTLNPTMKRTLLAKRLQEEIKWVGPAPEIEVLERKISEYKNPIPPDLPWGLASLAESPIPPEALPKVMEIFGDKLLSEGVHLTVREAKWIARLSFLPISQENIYRAALEYANVERYAELKGFDVFIPVASGLIDDTLLYVQMRQEMKKTLSPEEILTLTHRNREEWDRYKEKSAKNKKKLKAKEAQDERAHSQAV